MNKKELVEAASIMSGVDKKTTMKSINAVLNTISHALKDGDNVRLVGFGTFSVLNRKARTGRNPLTGESIAIEESTQPKFKAGQILKDLLND